MHWLALGLALLLAFGIIAIGVQYIANTLTMARTFGLPYPESGPNIPWWLRLKGVRDITSGLVVLAMMVWGSEREVGLVLAVEALIPTGDMLTILAAKGSTKHAFGVHGLTAVTMLVAAVPLLMGMA